ncbi:hypothetical protein DPEC_G00115540 [Dallia pectoralis]|uniref:Uncharacterized protein n=1 Tax=Dallia pectoralis TaxID=75939 RepID=A0ACC2GTY4_DALPE|nr:hypothetical protein DPEC_G00115540 [Dallia pectoralis]
MTSVRIPSSQKPSVTLATAHDKEAVAAERGRECTLSGCLSAPLYRTSEKPGEVHGSQRASISLHKNSALGNETIAILPPYWAGLWLPRSPRSTPPRLRLRRAAMQAIRRLSRGTPEPHSLLRS